MHRLMGYLRIILPCTAMFACSHAAVEAANFWGIGELPDNDVYDLNVSADGSTVVVTAGSPNNPPWHTQELSFLWTVETGLVGLGLNDHGLDVYAYDISGDGSLIVGIGHVPNPDSSNPNPLPAPIPASPPSSAVRRSGPSYRPPGAGPPAARASY